jgi:hypothetical protein
MTFSLPGSVRGISGVQFYELGYKTPALFKLIYTLRVFFNQKYRYILYAYVYILYTYVYILCTYVDILYTYVDILYIYICRHTIHIHM